MTGVIVFSPTERRARREGRPMERALALMIAAERQGVRFYLHGGAPHYRDPRGALTPELLAALRRHRAEIAAILREAQADAAEERAAILEFDAGLSRAEAERRARAGHGGGDAA